jgi:hypothetical protein
MKGKEKYKLVILDRDLMEEVPDGKGLVFIYE